MAKSTKKKGYTAKDLREVSDNPEWTKDDFAKAKPFAEALPELASTIRRRGPNKAPTKVPVSIRLSSDVVKHYKGLGEGWQTKIDETLRKAAKLKAPARQ